MKKVLKRSVLALAATASLAAGGYWGYGYWTVGRFLQSTDDAYVKADYTTVALKVSGYVAEVMVADNQKVAAGQVLARVDDRDFRTALARAQADVADAGAGIRSLDAQLALQQPVIAQGRADDAAADAALGFARADDARYRHLMETGYGTVQRAEQAAATLREDAARLARARAALDSAEKQLAVLKAQRAEAETQLAHNRAALAWTEAVTLVSGTHVPDAAYEEARRHFPEERLVKLTLAVGAINVWNRLAISFRSVHPAGATRAA